MYLPMVNRSSIPYFGANMLPLFGYPLADFIDKDNTEGHAENHCPGGQIQWNGFQQHIEDWQLAYRNLQCDAKHHRQNQPFVLHDSNLPYGMRTGTQIQCMKQLRNR